MGGVAAGTVARVAGGIGLVACAAVIGFASGGSGSLFGGLGSLFGTRSKPLEVARTTSGRADIVAAPTAAQRAAALIRARQRRALALHGRRAPGHARAHHHHAARPSPPAGAPAPQPPPQPAQPLPPPPAPPPAPPPPAPGHGQIVTTVGNTVKRVVGSTPPQLQPLTTPIGNVVDTLVATCQGLPVCP